MSRFTVLGLAFVCASGLVIAVVSDTGSSRTASADGVGGTISLGAVAAPTMASTPTDTPTVTPASTPTDTAIPTSTPTPIALSSCPPRISGAYVGTTDSGAYARPLGVYVVFDGVNIVGDPPDSISGFVDCTNIYISYTPSGNWYGASLSGVLSADGTSFAGTYSFSSGGASGYGVFQVSLAGANSDTDQDGFADPLETALRKDPNTYCGIMRADVDYDGSVSILDLSKVAQSFGQTIPPAPARNDQDGDGVVTILDLSRMAGAFGKAVTLCP